MDIVDQPKCLSCGAVNVGTKFCEECGEPMPVQFAAAIDDPGLLSSETAEADSDSGIPQKPVPATRGFVRDGAAQLRAALRGRSARVISIVCTGIIVIEIIVGGVLLSLQHADGTFQGYDYGTNVGAAVATSAEFVTPDIVDEGVQASTDGKYVFAIAASPNVVRAFDASTLQPVSTAPIADIPRTILVSANGSIVVQSGDNTLQVYSALGGVLQLLSTSTLATTSVSEIALSSDASTVFAIGNENEDQVLAFDARTGAKTSSVSIDGTNVYSISSGKDTVWANTSGEVAALGSNLEVIARDVLDQPDVNGKQGAGLTATPDGTRVLYSDGNAILALQGSALTNIASYPGTYSVSDNDVVSPDGATAARTDYPNLFIFSAADGTSGFQFPINATLSNPVILKHPSDGFVTFTYTNYGSDTTTGHLTRYVADAPRVTPLGLIAVYLPLDIALLLLALLVVFLIPVVRRRNVISANAQAVQAEKVRQFHEAGRQRAELDAQKAAAAAAESAHAVRVQQIAQWEAAWHELHPGEPLPAMPAVPVATAQGAAPSLSERTNTLAILALVFGLGGGLLGIIFGHSALAQIARTGERGRGMAIAGLLFGYLGLAAAAIIIIAGLALGSRH